MIQLIRSVTPEGGPLRSIRWIGVVLVLAWGLTACDSTGVAPGENARMTLSVTGASNAKSQTFTDEAGNTLTIDSVEIVLREIEFERAEDSSSCESEDDDACEEVESGPVLVRVPLDSATPEQVLETELPVGQWEEVEFEVHKLDRDDPEDRPFLEETGFPEGVSIRVTGTWTPISGPTRTFTYSSDLNEEQEIELEPPLTVTAGAPANVTFSVDVSMWFRGDDGRLVDPTSANDGGPNEDLVEDNIENSIEAFEDDDRDGDDDDDDSDDE